MTLRNLFWALLLIMSATALEGCSFLADFYVVNQSEKPVKAIIQFSSPIEQLIDNERELTLRYADTILVVGDNTKNLLLKKLSYNKLNSHTIAIEIPKSSTVLIGGTINRAIAADSIKFIMGGHEVNYSDQSIYKHLKRTGGRLPPFHFTYTINK